MSELSTVYLYPGLQSVKDVRNIYVNDSLITNDVDTLTWLIGDNYDFITVFGMKDGKRVNLISSKEKVVKIQYDNGYPEILGPGAAYLISTERKPDNNSPKLVTNSKYRSPKCCICGKAGGIIEFKNKQLCRSCIRLIKNNDVKE